MYNLTPQQVKILINLIKQVQFKYNDVPIVEGLLKALYSPINKKSKRIPHEKRARKSHELSD
jgi:hypothetical protein